LPGAQGPPPSAHAQWCETFRAVTVAWTSASPGKTRPGSVSVRRKVGTIRCPNRVVIPFQPGQTVRFPADDFQGCPFRDRQPSISLIYIDRRMCQEVYGRNHEAHQRSQNQRHHREVNGLE
jgi:hypothetical protein